MKIYRIFFTVILAFAMLFSVGCSEDNKDNSQEERSSSVAVKTAEDMPYQYDLGEYVKLGQYKGIEYEKREVIVTDELLDEKINSVLSDNATSEESKELAKLGDTVTIEYVGKIDGEAFSGGSTTSPVDIVLGSSGYISGFDDGVVGMKAGETKDIDVTFPDPYPNNTDFSGKPAVFTVTCEKVMTEKLPEFNDDFVKSISNDYQTVADYKEYLKNVVYQEQLLSAEQEALGSVWSTAFNNATIYSCPQVELDRCFKLYKSQYENGIKQNNMEFADYLESVNMTEEEFDEQLNSQVTKIVEQELVLYAIAAAENITLSDDEFDEWVNEYAENNSDVSSADEVKSKFSKSNIMQSALTDKILDFLYDSAVNVSATTTVTSSDDTTAAATTTAAAQ